MPIFATKDNLPSQLIDQLRTARHVAILTGAGMSAESGVPTFRDAQTGLWAQYEPEELATPEAFRRNPRLVWEWYAWRKQLVNQAQPNPGHYALLAFEQHLPKFTLITQNVDGMHQRVGNTNVIELHGNINRFKRLNDNVIVESWADNGEVPPRCPQTGQLLRPDVVWFGEALPSKALSYAFEQAAACDLLFSIGTSGMVHPAADLPAVAKTTIEINPDKTMLTNCMTYVLQGASGEILPALVKATWPRTGLPE